MYRIDVEELYERMVYAINNNLSNVVACTNSQLRRNRGVFQEASMTNDLCLPVLGDHGLIVAVMVEAEIALSRLSSRG